MVLRNYTETRYGAKSWKCKRRVAARLEASTLGMDIRYVVTSLAKGSAEHIYDTLYCARGPDREPDQAAQGPARQRSHFVPLGQCQPDAADPTYCRLLAAVAHPTGHPQGHRARPPPSSQRYACGSLRSPPASSKGSCPGTWCSSPVAKLTGRALTDEAGAAGQLRVWSSEIFG